MGNHVWDRKEALPYIDQETRIIRPVNYPPQVPGRGWTIYTHKGQKIGVINASGRVFMDALDCPSVQWRRPWRKIRKETKIIIVDFHAEATSEKIALGRYLDGRVSAVVGTHTHVQTADEQILPAGTAYITDIGMTGPRDAIIGVKAEAVLYKFLTQMPARFEVPKKGPIQFNAVLVDIDVSSGLALDIKRLIDFHEI